MLHNCVRGTIKHTEKDEVGAVKVSLTSESGRGKIEFINC